MMSHLPHLFALLLLSGICSGSVGNLSCYQCVRQTNEECNSKDLVPCSSHYDRCVTHIENNDKTGYIIKRECGLGPCAFEDNMVNRGLGLDACDRSKAEYFCVSCCRTSGCNQSSGQRAQLTLYALCASFLLSLRELF